MVIVIPLNSFLYLINYIILEPLIEGKMVFKLFAKGINRYIF